MGLLSIYFLVFEPTIRTLNAVLRNARSTVLQFPDDVINGIAPIRTLVREFAKAGQPKA